MAPTLFFLTLLVHISIVSTNICNASTLPKFAAILIFGDSSVDTGNNNFIATSLKANHYPYGLEFPNHVATGRFSDGRLIPDLLASSLGIKEFVPPYLDPSLSDDELRTGVCFASAGSGYDDLTSSLSNVIPVSKQITYFTNYKERLKRVGGEEEANKIVNGALVLISAGTNDFVLNFYNSASRRQFNITGYQDFLLQRIRGVVKELYDLGCRNFIIPGLFPIGCGPIQIASRFKNPAAQTCLEDENADARVYNSKLEKLLLEIQTSLQGSKVMYGNIYDETMDMINNPQKYGFVETNRGCCGTGFVEVGSLCNAFSQICLNPSQYIFWDAVHPSEAVYRLITKNIVENVLPERS